jgi:hypothetical protein
MRTLWGRGLLAAFVCAVFVGLFVGTSRADPKDDICAQCQHGASNCLVDRDANGNLAFHGCCERTACYRSNGMVGGCCNDPKQLLCNSTANDNAPLCVAACPVNTNFCQATKTCAPSCKPPLVFEPLSCECVGVCPPGRARCGGDCCPTGEDCASPELGKPAFRMHCCPRRLVSSPPGTTTVERYQSTACGEFCEPEVWAKGGICCSTGPQYDPITGGFGQFHDAYPSEGTFCCGKEAISLGGTQMCCGGSPCSKLSARCINNQCVPNKVRAVKPPLHH